MLRHDSGFVWGGGVLLLAFGARDTQYSKRTTTNTYTSRYNLHAKEPLDETRPNKKNKVRNMHFLKHDAGYIEGAPMKNSKKRRCALDVWMDGWMDGWVDRLVDSWMCVWINVWMHTSMDGCVD